MADTYDSNGFLPIERVGLIENESIYRPRLVSLRDQLNEGIANKPPKFLNPNLVCQQVHPISSFSSVKERKFNLEDKCLSPEDHQKYRETVEKLLKQSYTDKRVEKDPSLENILRFCISGMWHIVGDHDELGAMEMLFRADRMLIASDLIDMDNPPPTKCSFFNSAFAYLFEEACKYFNRSDLLEKYQIIGVSHKYLSKGDISTHEYLGLVSFSEGEYRITAIDPYHTPYDTGKQDNELLFDKLDRTRERSSELYNAFLVSQILDVNESGLVSRSLHKIRELVDIIYTDSLKSYPEREFNEDIIDKILRQFRKEMQMMPLEDDERVKHELWRLGEIKKTYGQGEALRVA